MLDKNISTNSIVLSRINYGEKDRILTVLTPDKGKLRLLAKSVRSGKSKLAGGIELFSENHIVLVRGRSEMFTLTSAKMINFYADNITKDIKKSEFAYTILKNINKLTPDGEGSEYYPYVLDILGQLDNPEVSLNQLKTWFNLKILDLNGSTPNLKTLRDGQSLPSGEKYNFDYDEHCFFVSKNGDFSPDHIKVLRYFNEREKFKSISGCPDDLVSSCSLLTERLVDSLLD